MNLILVYGLGETPMMLASNISIKNKEDVIKITRCYINRWRIEEYFKFKKQEYNWEKVCLWFYQIARGIYNILKMAKTGIKEWENIRKS